MAALETILLAPSGSTGTLVGSAATPQPLHNGGWDIIALQFVVEAILGGSQTITYNFQGSLDGNNWYDIGYITDASDNIVTATRTMTAVGAQVCWISNPIARRYLYYRVQVPNNVNMQFRAEVYRLL